MANNELNGTIVAAFLFNRLEIGRIESLFIDLEEIDRINFIRHFSDLDEAGQCHFVGHENGQLETPTVNVTLKQLKGLLSCFKII
ncbi:hypothetical protein MKX57_03270 [Lysinibacillus sp. FSL M8-0216]|uniref:hypothetical protein n=1 Tax=Lysinibacillus sp. FSL M8-0216 TaxID=2921619 RepID=UPI00315ABCDD